MEVKKNTVGQMEMVRESNSIIEDKKIIIDNDLPFNLTNQVFLLMWKRSREFLNQKKDLYKLSLPPVLVCLLLLLVYYVTSIGTFDRKSFITPGFLEPFIVPIGFIVYLQSMVTLLTHEKQSKIQESLRMMGMNDLAYWLSYIVTDGIILGFFISLVCSLISIMGGLFNNASFHVVFFLFFTFSLSMIPMAFFVSSFFDNIGSAGNFSLGLALGSFVCYIAFSLSSATITTQSLFSLFPPIAFQIACASFQVKYYEDISDEIIINNVLDTNSLCLIMLVDFFIYSFLAWYFNQVFPSEFGVKKEWYFLLNPNYWFPKKSTISLLTNDNLFNAENNSSKYPIEAVDETKVGIPAIKIQSIKKSYSSVPVLNGVSLEMYENQIFALLGHNGAGKSTIINILTGLIEPDYDSGEAFVYNKSIRNEMYRIRRIMGVCPQHDVLFENLTVREHIIFFSQLKGNTYEQACIEADSLTKIFHLNERFDHLGHELSGGQKRKLSVSIAICGGSKFIVLDEPTAGMDPLARREFWDLLASLKQDRSILLTTHYMDEADILGDRIGIMSLGEMQCLGSSDFLKRTFGVGYKLLIEKELTMSDKDIALLTSFIQSHIQSAMYATIEENKGADDQIIYTLPFSTIKKFGNLFLEMDTKLKELKIKNYGIQITSLTDVFLRVGADETVKPLISNAGIGLTQKYESSFGKQIYGIMMRRLNIARHDFVTIPIILLPLVAAIVAAVNYADGLVAYAQSRYIVSTVLIVFGYISVPGLIAEFLCRERKDRLRNVLTVMGCDFRAYWIGSFLGDMMLMLPIIIATFISWPLADMGPIQYNVYSYDDYFTYTDDIYGGYYIQNSHTSVITIPAFSGLAFLFLLLFIIQLLGMSYFYSFLFQNPKSCIIYMPAVIILLLLMPLIVVLLYVVCSNALGTDTELSFIAGLMLWGMAITTPFGAVFCALLNNSYDFSSFLKEFPDLFAATSIMIIEIILYFGFAYYFDVLSVSKIPLLKDEHFDENKLLNLDSDILDERQRTIEERLKNSSNTPLTIERLRKVFPSKRVGGFEVEAVQDLSFNVQENEIFGLLGANGSGKSTTLSMLTRHILPTAGDAHLSGYSILSEFSKGATHLGVVTQNNSLWDLMTVYNHLDLFGRLRGIPEDTLESVVLGTLDQLELTPHKYKLAKELSGGMKRKLCVAIALIGDPAIVLLDEPSAGLDPVSQQNLWNVILRTMSHRSVILTTHSMEEAEVLCKRISIMVKGQLRAIGTKQHLKKKYGAGYELTVKINIFNFIEQSNAIYDFIRGLFPSARLLSENGGLLSFEINIDEMNVGLAFNTLEKNKENLNIYDYSISQPTLEQVFIKTVIAHSRINGTNINPLREGLGLSSGQRYENGTLHGVEMETEQQVQNGAQIESFNKCRMTNSNTRYLALIFGFVSFITFILMNYFATAASSDATILAQFFAVIFIISIIISCSMCWTLCLPCLQPDKGLDEN